MKFWCSLFCLLAGFSAGTDCLQAEGSRRIAGSTSPGGRHTVAAVVAAEQIQVFRGNGDQWKSLRIEIPGGSLVADAPLILMKEIADEPKQLRVLTVTADGRFVLITATETDGQPSQVAIEFSGEQVTRFPVRTNFSFLEQGNTLLIYGVNEHSELVELNFRTSEATIVEGRVDAVLPGGGVKIRAENSDELYLVDCCGNLVSYVRDPIRRWKGPLLIGSGFRAGSDLVVWRRPDGALEDYIAAVNARGELRLMRHEASGWRMEIAPGWLLPSGTPISVFHTPINIRLIGVTGAGVLQEMHLLNTEWRQKILSTGYHSYQLTYLPVQSLQSISIDASGDLLSATNAEEVWTSFLVPSERDRERGQVLSRSWSPSEYESQEFLLLNPSTQNLVVRLRDRRRPLILRDIPLGSGQTVTLSLDCEKARTLTTQLKSPDPAEAKDSAGSPPAGGAETQNPSDAQAVAAATTTSSTGTTKMTQGEGPVDIEVFKLGNGISYQDVRLHKFPRTTTSSTEISLGGFAVTKTIHLSSLDGEDADVNSITANSNPAEIDVVKSAARRQITSINGFQRPADVRK